MSEDESRSTVRCPACAQDVPALDGACKVHFPTLLDPRPCVGSWKRICSKCGGLLATVGGKLRHVTPNGSHDVVEIVAAELRCDGA